jgi:hypothetical protein
MRGLRRGDAAQLRIKFNHLCLAAAIRCLREDPGLHMTTVALFSLTMTLVTLHLVSLPPNRRVRSSLAVSLNLFGVTMAQYDHVLHRILSSGG